MFDVDDIEIGHSMMIGAKGYQVIKRICATLRKGCNVMHMHMVIEPADSALVAIPHHGLLFNKLPFAALPIAVHVRDFGVRIGKALSIAVVSFLDLAGKFPEFLAAIVAGNGNFISAAGRRCQALPFEIASPIPASHLVIRGPFFKGFPADRAGYGFFAAPVIPVVRSSVLVMLNVPCLSISRLALGDNFAATTCAINGLLGLGMVSIHKSIIHA